MSISNIISLLGGVALFLFGITLMGEGLKKVAGSKLELVLFRLSGTPLRGMLLGAGVTSVIQSSSATSVMVVGFVNSGMMKVRQAISVVMGAMIGTSITGWIICLSSLEGSGGWVSVFSTSTLTALTAVVGIVLRMFSKKSSSKNVGDTMLGFAVLMFGMQAMSSAVSPLRESETFIRLIMTFSDPLVGILVGIAFTSVIQSASAAVGILQALSMTGVVTFSAALPLLLGITIGAAVPVLISALGARVDGRRTAFAYLAIGIVEAVIAGVVFYGLDAFFDFAIKDAIMSPVSIAAANTVFRAATTVVMLPAVGLIEKVMDVLIKESANERTANAEFDRLDERFLTHPALAVEQSRLTVNSMARLAWSNLLDSIELLSAYSEDGFAKAEQDEELVDKYEDKLGTYLVKLNAHELGKEENECVSKFLHTLSDFERISDHAMNIAETAREISEKSVKFSDRAAKEIKVLSDALREILELAVSSFVSNDIERAYRVEPLEELVDNLCDEMKIRHVERLQDGVCSLQQGFVFNDILTNFERVADHCSNIAVAMIELDEDSFYTHGYIEDLKELRSHNFDAYYEEYRAKYSI